ncbi:MAG: hypothetical protein H7842_12125 [Gammaproteobacteria bacterium SHHR-1]|uniref:hypothetical protein n=1 Tax=Magnetovirga frankeli TaxID=947516 RepID=UPI001293E1CD|nr:hypothetical protein D5125_16905 [gamma proteobacterium SS-5]
MYSIDKQGFENLVLEACSADADLRHEIERHKIYGAYAEVAETAYELFRRNFLSLREAFGLTERSRR